MKKEDTAKLPPGVNACVIGLGWSCKGNVDLDTSIICFDANMQVRDTIFFGNKKGSGITHRGDNTDGEGKGDDERIRIDFDQIPYNIT